MGVHVLAAFEARPVVSATNRPTVAATAPPGVPDPAQPGGSELSVRLLQAYGADGDSVQHDQESIGE